MTQLNIQSKRIWLWLHKSGSHYTAQHIARCVGGDSVEVFRRLHEMTRRQLVEQLDALPGERHKRYGVTDECLVPLGVTVGELGTGYPAPAKAAPAAIALPPVAAEPPEVDGIPLSPAERAYLQPAHGQEARC